MVRYYLQANNHLVLIGRTIRRKGHYLLFCCVLAPIICACGPFSEKQKQALNDALRAIQKVQAATQVGVTYQQYGSILIDAKAAMNQATSLGPECELMTEMNNALEAYVDASEMWRIKIADSPTVDHFGGTVESNKLKERLIKKYPAIEWDDQTKASYKAWRPYDEIMQMLWAEADRHLRNATSVAPK